MRTLALLVVLAVLAACAPSYRDQDVTIASKVDFDPARYAGLWYEIARYDVPFQRGCTATTAQYALKADGTLSVLNRCARGAPDGPVTRIEGSAEVVGPGRLAVSFDNIPFLRGPYWVLWVDADYRTAVVGTPSGRAGWILNRQPSISRDRLNSALQVLDFNGYDTSQLLYTEHASP